MYVHCLTKYFHREALHRVHKLSLFPSSAPGPVSGFSAVPKFTSIFLSWGRPENPNGEIISYEFTYRIGSGESTTDLATTFTIQLLSPSTTVSNLSVTAYTRAGRGETTTLGDVITPVELTLRKSGKEKAWSCSCSF